MKNCEQLIDKIQSGEKGVQEALKEMYADADFQKSAAYSLNKFRKLKAVIGWEDIFAESILRFVNSILSEKRKERPVKNCNAFFFAICDNVAKEFTRASEIPEGTLPDPGPIDQVFIATRPYVEKLSPQCRLLLELIYYHQPPYDPKEREVLVEILETQGYNVQANSISTVISRCKNNLAKLIKDDFHNFEGFDLD
jgi:hypothetical protein